MKYLSIMYLSLLSNLLILLLQLKNSTPRVKNQAFDYSKWLNEHRLNNVELKEQQIQQNFSTNSTLHIHLV